MPYIYKITNDVNNKVYIGKTLYSDIIKRFKEHCHDATREHCEKRPLYAAMNKYGVEHFKIEAIEECAPELLNDRERYWIEQYRSFKYGYNATIGGDGRPYLDYDLIIKTYNETKSIKKSAELLSIAPESVSKVLYATKMVSQEDVFQNWIALHANVVGQYDKNTGELIAVYPSVSEAERHVPTGKHIGQVCTGKRRTAGGFLWKYI